MPDVREPLDTMLHDYVDLMLGKLAAIGGPEMASKHVLSGLWDDFDTYLPPHGRVLLTHDEAGTLIGCGFMRQVRSDAGKMKRLIVERMEAARAMLDKIDGRYGARQHRDAEAP